MVLNANINIVNDFGQCFGEKKANQLDCDDLGNSFCISGFLYELILNTAYSFFFFFRSNICIPFLLIRKISTFYQTIFFKICKNVHNWSICFAWNHEQQNIRLHFTVTSLVHFVWFFGTMASYKYTKLTYVACLLFYYNFRTW